MKKLLVHLESGLVCGIWDDFIAYAEDEFDNNLSQKEKSRLKKIYGNVS